MHCSRHIAATTILLAAGIPLRAQGPMIETSPSQSASGAVFVENRGQFDPAVKYKVTTPSGTVSLTTTGVVFEGVRQTPGLARSPQPFVFSERFVGASPKATLEAGEPSTDAGTKAFSRVDYKNVWPGISVGLIGNGIGIEQQFMIQPGADPANIAVTYDGIDGMTIDEQGSLVIATPMGTLREGAPKFYQEVNGQQNTVPGQYRLTGRETYGFQIYTYNRNYPLVISPTLTSLSQPSGAATGLPVITFFNVAPTSMLPGQAAIGTFSVTGATSATLNGIIGRCNAGVCGGTVLFDPTSTTNYVLQASGLGGNVSASQTVQVGKYLPNPPPVPAGLQVTWQGACWLKNYPKSFCNGACQGMSFSLNIPTPPAQLPLEATLYVNSTTCNPSSQDNLNDLGTLTGSGGWIFWFTHHPNLKNSSAIWTIGNQSSGCVSYAKAPNCP